MSNRFAGESHALAFLSGAAPHPYERQGIVSGGPATSSKRVLVNEAEGSQGIALPWLPGPPQPATAAYVFAAFALGLGLGKRQRRQRPGEQRLNGAGHRARVAANALPPLLERASGKRELGAIIRYMLTHAETTEEKKRFLDGLKDTGFSWATKGGISLGFEDLKVPDEKEAIVEGAHLRLAKAEERYLNGEITAAERSRKTTTEWNAISSQVKDMAMRFFKEEDPLNPIYVMSNSGARGNASQVRQMVGMRGLMADITGQLIEVPVEKCLREGMSVADILISSNGARKGAIDKALNTAGAGYLYRRMDFAVDRVRIDDEDCGTTDGCEFRYGQGSISLKDRIGSRVLAADLIDPFTGEVLVFETGEEARRGHLLSSDDASYIDSRWKKYEEDLAARVDGGSGDAHADHSEDGGITYQSAPPIKVRTPLCCARPGESICKKCYGEDLSTPGKLVEVGVPVGAIAAQSLGEPGTQLTMRTFHTGGAFEGGKGEGIPAQLSGVVQLIQEDGDDASSYTLSHDDGETEWRRDGLGDLYHVIAVKELKLQVCAADDRQRVLQGERLTRGDHLYVTPGEEVSIGQVLFSKVEEDEKEEAVVKEEVEEDMEEEKTEGEKGGAAVDQEPDVDEEGKKVEEDDEQEDDEHEEDEEEEEQEKEEDAKGKLKEEDDIKQLLVADGDGTVEVVYNVPVAGTDESGELVWVLAGRPLDATLEGESCRWVGGQGDLISEGTPIAAEWAEIATAGVPRFLSRQTCNEVAGVKLSLTGLGKSSAGWRCIDWPAEEEEDAKAQQPRSKDKERIDPVPEDSVARVDFDYLTPSAGRVGKYQATLEVPQQLKVKERTGKHKAPPRPLQERYRKFPHTISPSTVYVQKRGQSEEHDQDDVAASAASSSSSSSSSSHASRQVEVVSTAPSTGDPAAIRPVSRIVSKEHVVPRGGLLYVKEDEEHKDLWWCPEEVHRLDIPRTMLKALYGQHGRSMQADDPLEVDGKELLRAKLTGVLCVCLPTESPKLTMSTGRPAAKRRGTETEDYKDSSGRLCQTLDRFFVSEVDLQGESEATSSSKEKNAKTKKMNPDDMVSVICVITPGTVIPLASKTFDSKAWHESTGALKEYLVPTGVDIVPGVVRSTSSPTIVGMLSPPPVGEPDSDGGGGEAKLLLRPVHHMSVPNSEPKLEDGSNQVLLWHLPYASSTVLESSSPVALAYQLRCSVGRHPCEPHAVSFAAPPSHGGAWPLRDTVKTPCQYTRLEHVAEWDDEELTFIQHSPLTAAWTRELTWEEPPLRHVSSSDLEERADGRRACVIPQRQTSSPSKGWIVSGGIGDASNSQLVLVSASDLVSVVLEGQPTVKVGDLVRKGDNLDRKAKATTAGQVFAIEKTEDGYTLLLRRGRPYLVVNGEKQVYSGAVVKKGETLGFERMVQEKTSDIVQGLPQIAGYFEATSAMREAVAEVLKNREKSDDDDSSKSVDDARQEQRIAARTAADIIQSAYKAQGVGINGRHIELIARRMTERVKVEQGGNHFPTGSMVRLSELERAQKYARTKFRVQTMLKGLTELGRDDSHMIVSMGFREADKSVVDHALRSDACHDLDGMKENIIVGKPITAGKRLAPGGRQRYDPNAYKELPEPPKNTVSLPSDIWE